MNLSGWNSRRLAESRASSRARTAVSPMSPVSMPARLTASSGRSKAVAIAASRSPSRSPMRRSPDRTFDDVLGGQRVAPGEELGERCALGRRPGRGLDRGERGGDVGEAGRVADSGRGCRSPGVEQVGHRHAQVGGPVVGRAERPGRRRRRARSRPPRSSPSRGRSCARRPRRTAGRPGRRRRSGARREPGSELVGEQAGLLGGPRRGGDPLGDLAPAAHVGGWYTFVAHAPPRLVPGLDHGRADRPAAACPGEPRRVPALVRRPRRGPPDPLPGRADAGRRDRPLLPGPGRRTRLARAGDPRPRRRPAHRDVRVQPARRATTARPSSTSRSARRTPGVGATAPRRPS